MGCYHSAASRDKLVSDAGTDTIMNRYVREERDTVALWLCYGVVLRSWPMILTNVVTLGMTIAILSLKLRYRA